jgi:hypothetical protein
MKTYLVGLGYHEPEGWQLYLNGIDDYESSTAVFITATSDKAALEWGEHIAGLLFKWVNPAKNNPWKCFGYDCWIEKDLDASGWAPVIGFFQHVNYGKMPNLDLMGTEAFISWQKSGAG